MEEEHRRKVDILSNQIKGFYRDKIPFRIFHGSTNSTRILSFKQSEMIDVSGFDKILSIDIAKKVATVEPNVSMDTLVDATLQLGLMPPVVTEFPGITVGGGIQGGAGESSSFKWGFFSQTVQWVEYALADGSVIKASPTKHSDLFYGAAGSSGTLGVITAIKLKLIPAKEYVHLSYQPVTTFASAIDVLSQVSSKEHDFVDGIMFGKDHGVIITGKLSDEISGKIRHFSRAHDPWYYLHAAKIDTARTTMDETVPLKDYLFRYNRGAFWVGRYAFERFGIPFNSLFRFLLNPILNTRKLYQALQESNASQEYIVQDLTLPLKNAEQYMQYVDTLNIYPLWICPIKPETRSPFQCNGIHTPLAINIGVWGPRIANHAVFIRLNQQIEAKLSELGGKKWLYAHTYYTEKEFWRIYDKVSYEKLRRKYHATTLPNIFDKVRVQNHHKVNVRHGLLRTITGQAKLHIED